MVGTRHAVSDNKSKSGLGMPSPYIPEREQIQDRKAGLKGERKTENGNLLGHTPSARCARPPILGGQRGRKRKRKTSIPPSVASLLVTPVSGGQRKLENCATQQNKFLQGVQRYGERDDGDLTMCVCRDMHRGRVGG